MFRSFTPAPDFTPFQALRSAVDLDEPNKIAARWPTIFEGFDFTDCKISFSTLFSTLTPSG
jgi:hypothetical protein